METALREADTRQMRRAPHIRLQRMTKAARKSFGERSAHANKMDWRRLEALFRQEPLLKRGIVKHSGDLVKGGFVVVQPGTVEPHKQNDEAQSWWRSNKGDATLREGLISGHVYGDGILEYEYDDDGASTDPVAEGARLVAVHTVDPVNISFEAFEDDDGSTGHWLLQRIFGQDPVRLHPDRYEHIKLTGLVGFKHGFSTVENAWHAALSKVKGDQALGEALFFGAHPKVWGTVNEGSDDDVEAVTQLINSEDFVRGFVWDERMELQQLNPVMFDPQPFYQVLAESISAAVGLPMPMLVGAQAGTLSGSETNITDYHADLRQVQETVLTDPVTRIVSGITGLEPGSFDIFWPPVGDDEKTSDLRDRAMVFTSLLSKGVKPLAAARIAGIELGEDDLEAPPENTLPPGTEDPDDEQV